jgi:ABC-type multidrug transport system fused ATPase/permease subunit
LYVLLLIIILRPIAQIDSNAHRHWNEGWGDAAAAAHQIETVKQAASEDYETKKTERAILKRAYKDWVRLEYIWNNISFFQRIIVFATQLTVFILSVRFIAEGVISVGELVALNGYALMFFGPFVTLGHSWQIVQNGLSAALRAEQVYGSKTEEYMPTDVESPESFTGAVSFQNVSFRYTNKQKMILENISFSTEAGETIALVGESGVGKSTLIALLSGYYFPIDGSVTIDGVDTRKFDLIKLRKRIAVVPQEVALFNDTVRNNLRYGSFEATEEDVERVVEQSSSTDFIKKLPDGYDTLVGERGVKLSVGQKQRVAIARAILREPTILILDEPTSALDAKTEQVVTESLEKLMKGRTTFIIAHRLSTVRKADKILVFEKGRIVEEGKHDDLIKIENGVYRKLYEYQIGLH